MTMGFYWGLLVPRVRVFPMQKCKEARLLTKTPEPPHPVPHCRLCGRLNSDFPFSHPIFSHHPPSGTGNQHWFCFHRHVLLPSLVMGGSFMKLSLLGNGPGFLDQAEPGMCCRTRLRVDRFCPRSWLLFLDTCREALLCWSGSSRTAHLPQSCPEMPAAVWGRSLPPSRG